MTDCEKKVTTDKVKNFIRRKKTVDSKKQINNLINKDMDTQTNDFKKRLAEKKKKYYLSTSDIGATENFGKSLKNFEEITNFLKASKIKHFIHKTEYKHHATKIARELTSKNKLVHIISVGGDGTLNEVLNGIVNFKNTYLSVLPFGSGNDFTLNFKEIKQDNQIENIKRIVKQKSIYVDYLVVNSKNKCMNAMGAGIIPNVIEKYMSYKHFSQKTKYKLATFSKCLFFTVHNIKYSIDKGKT